MKPSPRPLPMFAPPAAGVPLLVGWHGGPVLRSAGPTRFIGSYLAAAVWLAGAGHGHLIWKNTTKGRVVVTFGKLAQLRLCDPVGKVLEPA